MNDLISRSEVNDVIDELEVYTCGRPNTMKVEVSVLQLQRFINKLKNIPTAYDVDKVVEELYEERTEILLSNDYECEIINYCLDNFDNAIEIVKQGSVSDDTNNMCDWIKYDYKTICPKNHDANNPYWRIPDNMDKLKYCPYCGRR